jgi:hypothetical protein
MQTVWNIVYMTIANMAKELFIISYGAESKLKTSAAVTLFPDVKSSVHEASVLQVARTSAL